MNSIKLRYISIFGLLSLLCTLTLDVWAMNYEKYGGLIEDYPEKTRVDKVFHRVLRAVDKKILPKLKVVNGILRDPFMAFVLPTGEIVLSKGAIELCYYKVSETHGSIRLAFILGHELAHIANGHLLPKTFIGTPEQYKKVLQENRGEKGRQKEIEADKQGFIYAAMAGYAVDNLLWEKDGDFFLTWQKETDANWQPDSTHPSDEKRAKGLYKRLKALLDHLPYFYFGVRLSHFDRCGDAKYFFEKFKEHFPAREVDNNLGLCGLQIARKELGKAAYSYWLPSVLDVMTQAEDFSLPLVPKGEELSPQTKKQLIEAKRYFNDASEKDPYYVPAKVNFAIAAFYLGEFDDALAAIEKAHKLAPNDLDIQGLRAVIRYEKGEQLSSLQRLENLAQQSNAPLSVLYNLAQLLEKKKHRKAEKFWQMLAQQVAQLPALIGQIVCEKADCPPQPNSSQKANWDLPVKLGIKTSHDKTLGRPQSPVKFYDIYEQIYQAPNSRSSVLGLRGRVEMVVLKSLENLTLNELADYCGQPLRSRHVHGGLLWSCKHWAALVVDDKVKEVWVVKDQR